MMWLLGITGDISKAAGLWMDATVGWWRKWTDGTLRCLSRLSVCPFSVQCMLNKQTQPRNEEGLTWNTLTMIQQEFESQYERNRLIWILFLRHRSSLQNNHNNRGSLIVIISDGRLTWSEWKRIRPRWGNTRTDCTQSGRWGSCSRDRPRRSRWMRRAAIRCSLAPKSLCPRREWAADSPRNRSY